MAAAEGAVAPRTLSAFRAKRTQARPKHTLFGTALENVKKSELEGIDASAASRTGVKNQQERYPIPDELQEQLSARSLVQKARSDISGQNQRLSDAEQELKAKQLKALGFSPDPEGQPRRKGRDKAWLTEQDLEHSADINIVGLGKQGSYNRDKYGNKPPTHSYSLIGGVLAKGNEFGRPQRYDADDGLANLNKSDNNNIDAIRLGFNPPVDPDKEVPLKVGKSSVVLPPNIRHQFGSTVCDNLLEDKEKVTATLEKQRRESRSSKSRQAVDTKDYAARVGSNYFDVGHVTRYNTFPGHSTLDKEGLMKSTHNDVVYLRREPMIDEFRLVKDGYATWAEQNLMREKQKKLWDTLKS